ncbi:MAG TPA: fumarylacetoacetate hydrolase family protein [Balneolaceae bacterium]|nr:fumarylacetoacetate hydrolase family protein [Balneolaceae bacterium]|tara:strand:+ start:25949 stop:26599 length:651 start_codon:yes stop_codon:yes gene_type:complete
MNYPELKGLGLTAHSVFCVGRNYSEHAKEMGHNVSDEPIIFLKPISALCDSGSIIELPAKSNEVHHEAELVVAIGKSGKNIPENNASTYVAGFGIGIDFTARDLQKVAKQNGNPWSVAKGFDQFAPVSTFIPFTGGEIPDFDIRLEVNGEPRQSSNTKYMIFSIPALISYLSEIFTLQKGDLIFTGTPSGVSAIQSGDKIKATLDQDIATVEVEIR